MEFLDRRDESARLNEFLLRPEGEMACLYGRRRIGKSRLLEEVLKGRKDVVSYCADRSDAGHVRAELEAKARLLPFAADYERVETRLFVAEGGLSDSVGISWCESEMKEV